MKATRLDVLHKATVPSPVEDFDAAHKLYVDLNVAGGIFIVGVTPTNGGGDITGFFNYLPGTIPEDKIVTEATSNTASIRIHFLAEPKNTVFGVGVVAEWNGGNDTQVAQSITQQADDSRLYEGYVDIVVDDQKLTETVKLISSTGTEAQVDLNLLIGGPEVQSATLGPLPGSQTTVKQGDTVAINGTVGNDATAIKVLNFGASGSENNLSIGAEDSGGAGYRTFSGNITVANRTGDLAARVVASNLLGTEGDAFDSNSITLDQTSPSIGNAAIGYPAGQQAIKGNESLTLDINISNADVFDYSVDAGLSITNETTYEVQKTVTRVDETIQYAVGNTNLLTVTATRSSNGAVSVKTFDFNVVNTAPTAALSFLGNPSRLRSSDTGEDYTLQVTPSQPLLEAPASLDADVNAGEFIGNWSQSGNNYRHGFRVTDAHDRGNHNFSNLSIKGLSGIVASTITAGQSYEIGGVASRILVVPALSQVVAIGTNVADFSKARAMYVGADELERRTDTSQYVKGFTISDDQGNYDPNGDYLFLTDAAFAGTNTTGTLQVEFEETE